MQDLLRDTLGVLRGGLAEIILEYRREMRGIGEAGGIRHFGYGQIVFRQKARGLLHADAAYEVACRQIGRVFDRIKYENGESF